MPAVVIPLSVIHLSTAAPHGFQGTPSPTDTTNLQRRILERTRIEPRRAALQLRLHNVDITRFPEINLIVEVVGETPDTILPSDFTVVENERAYPVLSTSRLSPQHRVPVDFVFAVDVTGTMQAYVNGIRDNIERFTRTLLLRGIDYRLGLLLFSDVLERVYPLTEDVRDFLKWVSQIWASGGMDEKENALEALAEAARAPFRPAANRVIVLISDAPYHQRGERGHGRTNFTTESIIDYLREHQVRVFCITRPELKEYKRIAEATRGAVYDIQMPFSQILDQYAAELTNLWVLTYRTGEEIPPDSVRVAILDRERRQLVRQIIPVVAIGRKFILEHLLFETNSAVLPDTVPELEIIAHFLRRRPEVRIRIEGHADNRGTAAYNRRLSLQRAESVRQYLLQRGVLEHQLLVVAFGASRPIADNDTEFGRSLNRRVEIVIAQK
ncbi:MAG: OmpA family protein [Candidatus Kapabacteria bacterium]|nr:OmpA family protein [Candidatus Kapabacteria bacterium]MCS7169488.1 OmpA family protein [Candidatus Kapabacteria bacterium]MDW7996543.1 OmpA family protein [Bacteroidota bacterium]MDW8225434.1 OmpA family protein [Bacteroidota bacterium]